MEKMRMESVDMTAQNVDKIATLFPNCITEAEGENGKLKRVVNFELLRQMLSGEVLEGDESYEFTWVGKKAAIVEANRPIRKTLRPCLKKSVNWDTTENLYIEGDNLEALKLMQESYLAKVDVIYIDPPYNTGNDFVYSDDYSFSVDEWEEVSGTIDDYGNRLFRNTDANGRFHSDWCSMIYARLLLARNLLNENGVIFISIDDNEQSNMKKMCDEIFGAEMFIATFKWNRVKKAPSLSGSVRTKYEYVLAYYKKNRFVLYGKASYNKQGPLWHLPNKRQVLEFPARSIRVKKDFLKGNYGGTYQVELLDDLICVEGLNKNAVRIAACSAWGQDKIFQYVSEGKTFEIKKEPTTVYTDLDSENNFIAPSDIINAEECEVKCNTDANEDLKKLGIPFDYSKPSSLIEYLLKMVLFNRKDGVVLDFFSGSATTAEALMRLNSADDGNRKFILIQIPEQCDSESDAYKAGYKNICEIGRERINRAAKRIMETNTIFTTHLDIGYRTFTLDESNMNDVYYAAGDYTQDMLTMLESNVKPDRTDLDLLFGCLIEWGLPLSMPYKSEKIESCTVHTYNDGDLIACFDENIPDSVIKTIANRQPLRAVFRDSSFNGSPAKINVGEIFKMLAPDTRVKVI